MPHLEATFENTDGGIRVQASSPVGDWSETVNALPHPRTGDPWASFPTAPDIREVYLRWWWSSGPSEIGNAIVETGRGEIAARGTEPRAPGGPKPRYAPALVGVQCSGFRPPRPADPSGFDDFRND